MKYLELVDILGIWSAMEGHVSLYALLNNTIPVKDYINTAIPQIEKHLQENRKLLADDERNILKPTTTPEYKLYFENRMRKTSREIREAESRIKIGQEFLKILES